MSKNELGDCYKVAFDIVVHEHREDDEYVLVHGTVVNPEDGVRHGHAWVEFTETIDFTPIGMDHTEELSFVIDRSNGNNALLPRNFYYKIGQVEIDAGYTAVEAARLAVRTRHYGPWHES